MIKALMRAATAAGCWAVVVGLGATPIVPAGDAEVIERLPPLARASTSADPATAMREARALLDTARRDGDPRPAGRALARLAHWQSDARAPVELMLLLANTEQYLHQFGRATTRLQQLVERDPQQPQAWLMLATLHRVQGRYGLSDDACRALLRLGAQPYADACAAENMALRGQFDPARVRLQALAAGTADAPTRSWLLTSLAELEQRAGRHAASDRAWRQALAIHRDSYTAMAYADFLLDQQRPREAWAVLQPEQRSDSTLLRLAIAARRAAMPQAVALQHELRERFALADQRPGPSGHERERALMALDIEHDPAAALRAARLNVQQQREPLDLLLLARCAAAAGDAAAAAEARSLANTMGLRDVRLAAL